MIRNIWSFYIRKIAPGFRIGRHERVVDIGSGDKPFWRGDVYFDNLALGDEQRFTASSTVTSFGTFVDGSLPATPFGDKEFDFSFCAHVLEHVPDPAAAAAEIVRISKRGYVEVPNGVLEAMDPFHSHLWLVFQDGDELVFYRKSRALHQALKANGRGYRDLPARMREPFIRHHWTGDLRVRVIDEVPAGEAFWPEPDPERMVPRAGPYVLVVRMVRWLFYRELPRPTSQSPNPNAD